MDEESKESTEAFLAKYAADRTHELEIEKVSAKYELGFIQAAGILNGASTTAFLSFFSSTVDKLGVNSIFWLGPVRA